MGWGWGWGGSVWPADTTGSVVSPQVKSTLINITVDLPPFAQTAKCLIIMEQTHSKSK